jgi:uncharacterized protein
VARGRVAPTRTCVACRTARAKRELVRIVRTPLGRIEPDPTGRMAGRGAYVCTGGTCLMTAIDKGALARALAVAIPTELRAELLARTAPMTTNDEGGERGQE